MRNKLPDSHKRNTETSQFIRVNTELCAGNVRRKRVLTVQHLVYRYSVAASFIYHRALNNRVKTSNFPEIYSLNLCTSLKICGRLYSHFLPIKWATFWCEWNIEFLPEPYFYKNDPILPFFLKIVEMEYFWYPFKRSVKLYDGCETIFIPNSLPQVEIFMS